MQICSFINSGNESNFSKVFRPENEPINKVGCWGTVKETIFYITLEKVFIHCFLQNFLTYYQKKYI